MMLLGFAQKIRKSRDIQIAESSAGQAVCDFLKQPSIAIGVTKRGE